jgi:hypothetical protein
MALRMAFWTCMNMNLTYSYFNIWQPWNKTWKIGFIWSFFYSFPLQVYLFEPKLTWNPFVYTISYSSNVHNFLQCIPNLFSTQDFLHYNLMAQCLVKVSHLQPIFFFVFNQETHSTFHHIYKTILNHYTFCPWHFGCPFNLELLGIVIRFFLRFFLNKLLFLTRWIRFHVKKRIKQINMGY